MIDGKASQYTDINNVLSSMGANNIEKIEVMANLSARYDVQGGALIIIILKKNANLGTNGTVSIAGSTRNYEMGKDGVDQKYNRITPSRFLQTNYSSANRNSINYRAEVDFYSDKKILSVF